MYNTFVVPIVEYASQVWNPHLVKDVDLLERIQRKFTKRIPSLIGLNYMARLDSLELLSLEKRRLISDLVLVYKNFHSKVCLDPQQLFTKAPHSGTRGHEFKLFKINSKFNCHKYSFSQRVVSNWNKLPTDVVMCTTVNAFRIAVRMCVGLW